MSDRAGLIAMHVVEAHVLTAAEWAEACRGVGREPTLTELAVFAALWSEHASYKSSRGELRRLPSAGSRVRVGPGENAGVVDIGDGLCLCFKIESKNHASRSDPYRGAALGVGGILRDIFTMGARPIASLASLAFGLATDSATRAAMQRAAEGISTYGNGIGVPTVGGALAFHEGYRGQPVVNVMSVGLVREDAIFLGRAVGAGNPVLYVGARTGRDGVYRAAARGNGDGPPPRSVPQIADPFTGKRLLEACLALFEREMVLGIQDMGAGGLAGSAFEMASRAGTGIDLELDDVPVRARGLSAIEILLSESPERMLLVCRPEGVGAVVEIFTRWDLECAVVGHVRDSGLVRAVHNGERVLELPVPLLTASAPTADRPRAPLADREARLRLPVEATVSRDLAKDLVSIMASPDLASRHAFFGQLDHTVRAGTIRGPGPGAALVRILGTNKAIGLSVSVNTRLVSLEPRDGAAMAVCQATRALACVGTTPIGITDCLNFGAPSRPEVMWSFAEAIGGIADASVALAVPVVSGNVSFSAEPDDDASVAIPPTPMCAVVGLRSDIGADVVHPSDHFVAAGDVVAVLGDPRGHTLGGSAYLSAVHGLTAGRPPVPRFEAELAISAACAALVTAGLLRTALSVAEGGVGAALARCTACHPGPAVGADITLAGDEDATLALFGEAGARILVAYSPAFTAPIAECVARFGAALHPVGQTGGDRLRVTIAGQANEWTLDGLRSAWHHGLDGLPVGARELTTALGDAI